MASPNPGAPSNVGKKVRRLGIGVVIVIALYSAGWFYGASQLETFLVNALVQGQRPQNQAQCDNLDVGGFPFLIGVTCDRVGLSDRDAGVELQTGAIRSAARIYMPGTALFELESPAKLAFMHSGLTLDGNWKSLRSSLAVGFDGLKRTSLEGRDVSVRIADSVNYLIYDLKIAHPMVHLRANGADLDLAFLVESLDFQPENQPALLPTLSASADLTLVGKSRVLAGGRYGDLATSGELRSFKLDLGSGIYGELSGPFSVDSEGWVSGTMLLKLEKLNSWEKTLTTAFPDAGATISGMAQLLRGLARGEDKVSVNLSIDQGTISLSMIPIGHIPQL